MDWLPTVQHSKVVRIHTARQYSWYIYANPRCYVPYRESYYDLPSVHTAWMRILVPLQTIFCRIYVRFWFMLQLGAPLFRA